MRPRHILIAGIGFTVGLVATNIWVVFAWVGGLIAGAYINGPEHKESE